MSNSRLEKQPTEDSQLKLWIKFGLINALTPLAVTAWSFPFRYLQTQRQILTKLNQGTANVTGLVKWRLMTINFLNSLRAAFTKSAIIANSKPMAATVEKALNSREPLLETEPVTQEQMRIVAQNKFRATCMTGLILGVPDALNPFINLSILNSIKKDPNLSWGQIWQVTKVGFSFRYTLSATNAVCLLSLPLVQTQYSNLFPGEQNKKQNYLLAVSTNSLIFSFLRAPLSTLQKNLVASIHFIEDEVTNKVTHIRLPSLAEIAKEFKGKNFFKLWRGSINNFPIILPTYVIVDKMPELVDKIMESAETRLHNRHLFFNAQAQQPKAPAAETVEHSNSCRK